MGYGHGGRKFHAALSLDRALSTISGHQSVNDECFTACCDLDILAFEVIPRTKSSFLNFCKIVTPTFVQNRHTD